MKTLLITGASSGIGAATARAAAEAGWALALAARSTDKLSALADEIGEEVLAIRCDVTEEADQKAMIAETVGRFGRLDAVFANAGISSTEPGVGGGDPDNWRDMLMINVWGAAVTLKHALPELKKSRGHAILTGSIAGQRTIPGSIYGVSKWAANALARNFREEVSGTGIRVTLLMPGMVDTPFFESEKPDALRPENIADGVVYALEQPASVSVGELLITPTPKA